MNKNVAVKQARLWEREVRRAASAGVPHTESMLDAMANYLSEVEDLEVLLGLTKEKGDKEQRNKAVKNYLKLARDGKLSDIEG